MITPLCPGSAVVVCHLPRSWLCPLWLHASADLASLCSWNAPTLQPQGSWKHYGEPYISKTVLAPNSLTKLANRQKLKTRTFENSHLLKCKKSQKPRITDLTTRYQKENIVSREMFIRVYKQCLGDINMFNNGGCVSESITRSLPR